MWGTGLRYDLRIAGMTVVPFLVLGLGLAGWNRGWGYLWRSLPTLVGITAFIVAGVAIGNYFYYQTYHNHIDVFAFGLVDDDTRAVLANLWQDYPVIKGVLGAILLALPPVWFSYRTRAMTLRPWPGTLFWGYWFSLSCWSPLLREAVWGRFPSPWQCAGFRSDGAQ